MTDTPGTARGTQPVAVVGLACRFPDADDPAALLEVVLTGRRSFRRLPAGRVDLTDYYQPDRATSDATYSTRAALLEGWRFECPAFGIDAGAYSAADPAHWLALETAARALAAAGLPAGTGLDRDRTGVIIGNTLGGDTSRANALRVRWPYVRRVLSEALGGGDIPAGQAGMVLQRAENSYLAPFPTIGPYSLAGSLPATIAAGISTYFGFRGGSHAVDSACSSSLLAVASACGALASGDLDAAIAGGVDLSLDPLELIGLAKAGLLATTDVRIYDEKPSGYLPGEGCGVVVLMRAADARAAGLPVYAEILGWGSSAGGIPGESQSQASSQLLAMRRAYDRSAIDPADIQFIEGNGAGTPLDDEAELTALNSIRSGARRPAVLGSVKANIGHAKAAAGIAGLIKTVLALGTGVLPPATGVDRPHQLIAGGDGRLTLPQLPQEWETASRLASVSAAGIGGSNVHVVLRHESAGRARQDRWLRSVPLLARAAVKPSPDGPQPRPVTGPQALPFLLHAPDRFALAAVLSRIADIAPCLSDAELQDLACLLGRDTSKQGRARVAIVATRQEQLAMLAREAVSMLPHLAGGLLSVRPGVFASDDADGRLTLLLSGEAAAAPAAAAASLSMTVTGCLDTLRWLETMEVHPTAAVGHGLGTLAGLAWAGVLGEPEVTEIAELRARFLARSAARTERDVTPGDLASATLLADTAADRDPAERSDTAALRTAIRERFRFGPPRRRLISTMTGAEIGSVDDAIELICHGFAGDDQLVAALTEGAVGATLLMETGPGRTLVTAAAEITKVPAISLEGGIADPVSSARVAAALFAAGALAGPQPMFARPFRPLDIWREQVFITSPCNLVPQQRSGAGETAPAAETAAADDVAAAEETAEAEHAISADEAAAADAAAAADEVAAQQTAPADETVPADAAAAPSETAGADHAAPAGAAAAADETAPADADHKAAAEDDGISGLRDEFERHPPALPLLAVAPDSDADAAEATAKAGAAIAVPASEANEPAGGLSPWVRCFTEGLRPLPRRAVPAPIRPWRMYAAARGPVLADLAGLFTADPTAGRTLAIVEDPADERSRVTAVEAARDAIATGDLVVLTASGGFTGFFASLHAENPSVGVTVLRVPAETISAASVLQHASAEPGIFRELVIGPGGSASEPVPTEVALPGGGDFPLGPQDVILLSRGARGAGLALAQVLACCGTGVAVVGRTGEYDDAELVAGLEELRSAGARVGYEVIDITDPVSLAAAVRRIEDRLGPVTAVGHGVSPDHPVPVHEITSADASAHAGADAALLDQLTGAVPAGQLRLIISFGTVVSRYGRAGAGSHALSSGALASRGAQLAAASIGCRSLHLDLPAWSSGGFGDRPELAAELVAAGTALVDIAAASRLLLKSMTTPDLPRNIAVHGRVGGLAAAPAPVITTAELAAAGLAGGGRFLREVSVYHPGTELVCTAGLSLAADPYLADYRVDGMPVLPPVLALEALAQAASVLAGRPVRRAAGVTLESPVLIPSAGEAVLRVCAQRDGDTIVAALRCADSSYLVDHARAEFSCAPEPHDVSESASAAASSALHQLVAGSSGLVDGAELYGPICFQSGRFRRVALLPEVTARSGRALARGADDEPWFSPGSGLQDTRFLLGSPGLNDATLQVLQACMPHRRVRPAGCESVQFSGRAAEGPVEIRAVARPLRPAGTGPAAGALIPGQPGAPEAELTGGGAPAAADPARDKQGQSHAVVAVAPADMTPEERADMEGADRRPQSRKSRRSNRRQEPVRQQPRQPAATAADLTAAAGRTAAGAGSGASARSAGAGAAGSAGAGTGSAGHSYPDPAGQRWDIEAVDAVGQLLAAWRGVQLHDSGPLPRNAAWPPTLLSVFLERSAVDLGLDDGLRVSVSCGQPDAPSPQLLSTVPQQSSPSDSPSSDGRHVGPERRAMNVISAPGTGALAGFGLTLRAPVAVAAGWVAVDSGLRKHQPAPAMTSAYTDLRARLSEPPAVLAARLDAVSACLEMAGLAPDGAAHGQLSVTQTTSDGWARLALGRAVIACAVVELSGVAAPVAIALLTRQHAHARSASQRTGEPVGTA